MKSPRLSRILSVAAVTSTLTLGGCSLNAGEQTSAGDTLMLLPENAAGPIGTVRRTDLLVAYSKSKHLKTHYHTLESLRDAATSAGDTKLAANIEAEGPAWQELLHNQLAGTEPLYTTLLAIESELHAVADAKGISKVVEAGPGVQGIDITDDLVAALKIE